MKRKMIIDTDCGSDDAVALLMACVDPDIEILGITTVHGNVPLALATKNTLQTLEVCGRTDIPVYPGAERAMVREPVHATNVHGQDGMGDLGLIHPVKKAEEKNAVDFLLETIRKYPNEIELVTLGPLTNIGKCIEKDRETMCLLKEITAMATCGLGPGNTTPVSEFNVYADAEACKLLISLDVKKRFAGFDMCVGPAAWSDQDIAEIGVEGTLGGWAVAINDALIRYNLGYGLHRLDLPDAVAMACVLWPDTLLEEKEYTAYCCVDEEATYGQVILYRKDMVLAIDKEYPPYNCTVVTKFDGKRYIEHCREMLKAKAYC